MKRVLPLVIFAVICVTVAACGGVPRQSAQDLLPTPSATAAPIEKSSYTLPQPDETQARRNSYCAALRELLVNHTLPNGDLCEFDGYEMSDNKFAIFDVDQDGEEELLLLYVSAPSAGMIGGVYAYDGKRKPLRTELLEYPALTFYDNGTAKADWSHNQGLAGDFWPYNLYRYDPSLDGYTFVGMVDAWDRDFAQVDGQGNPFPSAADSNGVGVVYYIMTDGQYDASRPVDQIEYEAWAHSVLGEASEMAIPYMNLTEDNIEKIRDAEP